MTRSALRRVLIDDMVEELRERARRDDREGLCTILENVIERDGARGTPARRDVEAALMKCKPAGAWAYWWPLNESGDLSRLKVLRRLAKQFAVKRPKRSVKSHGKKTVRAV
jgi:hypothetical protein